MLCAPRFAPARRITPTQTLFSPLLQVKELIRAVRPEVVMLELCKDRVGLLVDDRLEAQASNRWHIKKVREPRGESGTDVWGRGRLGI